MATPLAGSPGLDVQIENCVVTRKGTPPERRPAVGLVGVARAVPGSPLTRCTRTPGPPDGAAV